MLMITPAEPRSRQRQPDPYPLRMSEISTSTSPFLKPSSKLPGFTVAAAFLVHTSACLTQPKLTYPYEPGRDKS
jgi:hypothetical protein